MQRGPSVFNGGRRKCRKKTLYAIGILRGAEMLHGPLPFKEGQLTRMDLKNSERVTNFFRGVIDMYRGPLLFRQWMQ
jgi:hypothetical protein